MPAGFVSFLPVLLGVSALELGVGGAVGWWLARSRSAPSPENNDTSSSQIPVAAPQPGVVEPGPNTFDAEQARELLAQMQELAAGVASNVDQHSATVQAASNELTTLPAGAAGLPPAVMQAVTSILAANQQLKGELALASAKIQDQTHQIEARLAESRTDVLTGLANRRAFDDEISTRLQDWRDKSISTTLVMLDVDHFKKFNDTHGHLAGDEVLRGVSRVLKRVVGTAGLAARYGGEEFAAILPAATPEQARQRAEAVRTAIESSRFEFQGTELRVTASLGVSRPLPAEEAAEWIKRADEALYASKKSGRNCCSEHDGQNCHLITATPAQQSPPQQSPVVQAEPAPPATPSQPTRQTDTLTGLHSKQSLADHLNVRLAEWRRSKAPVAVALIELDHLENLRHLHGPATGDMVLCAATQFLQAALRETDLIARYADNTFGVLLSGLGQAKVAQVAERIRSAIEKCDSLRNAKGEPVRFTVSIGLTEAQTGDNHERLLGRADSALRLAIQAGRNCTQLKLLEVQAAPVAQAAPTGG